MITWAKRAVLLAGFVATIGVAGTANALVIGPINTGSYTGALTFKYSGVTTGLNLTPGSNETTWGAAHVTSVFETGNSGNNFYSDATPLIDRIGVIIYGIADGASAPGGFFGNNLYNIGCTGGLCDGQIHVDFYTLPNATSTNFGGALDISDRAGFSGFNGISDVGTLLMKWEMTPGKVLLDDPATLLFNDTLAVMYQNVTGLTLPASGVGQFFAECVSGPGCAILENNAYPNGADFDGGFDLAAITSGGRFTNGWRGEIEDPVRTTAMPEPGTIALFGFSLLGLGFGTRRRAKKS